MKDLYSAHLTEEDLYKYYWEVADAYLKIFKRMGLEAKIVEAGGGVFTESHTHEFQVLCEQGEDTIFYCDCGTDACDCKFAENKEIAKVKDGDKCPKCNDCKIKEARAIEVGNIFPLGTMYAEKMGVAFIREAEFGWPVTELGRPELSERWRKFMETKKDSIGQKALHHTKFICWQLIIKTKVL